VLGVSGRWDEIDAITLDFQEYFVDILPSTLYLCLFCYKPIRKDVIKMVCETVKEGYDCFFMDKNGCRFNGGSCHTVIDQCDGCQKVKEFPTGRFCLVFPDPSTKWRLGNCSMATHLKQAGKKENGKINPLKASKRNSK
jgi:hypothetical protein